MKKCVLKISAFLIIGILIGGASVLFAVRYNILHATEHDFHEHADFALFLMGERFDFSKDKYMNYEPCAISSKSLLPSVYAHEHSSNEVERGDVDLHNNNGNVIHVHREGINYSDFFITLGMEFNDTSFSDDEGNSYKEDDQNEFRFFINNQEVDSLTSREIRDFDRVLISYGTRNRSKDDLALELAQISNEACIASGTCGHRSSPEPEFCGLDSKSFLLRFIGL